MKCKFLYKQYEMDGIHQRNSIIEECEWFIESAKKLPDKGAI
ncbi:hypothetical protein [Clostridium botulinum]|nr:hypothetical protein [Clostridium botulinum]